MMKQKTVSDKIDEFLGLEPSPETQELVPTKPAEITTSGNSIRDMEDDFDYARKVMHELIDKSNELVDNANYFAREKQDARSVEAASMAGKEVRENVVALIGIHKTRRDIEKQSGTNVGGDLNVTQNAVFVGSTGELLKHMKELNSDGSLQKALNAIDVTPDAILDDPEDEDDALNTEEDDE